MARRHFVHIEMERIASVKELHELLLLRLDLSEYYGRNWDAFEEVIATGHILPYRLVLQNWSGFETKFRSEAEILLQVLERYNTEPGHDVCEVVLS